ncbi:MAG: hypothetical protein IKW89_05175 [Bacteroidales bacterium]|nr:hypothetical protein [Bacteroidales bacterium]
MEEILQVAVSYFLDKQDYLRNCYPRRTIVLYKNVVVFDALNYEAAYVWVFIDSFHKNRDFMDYFIADLKTNGYLGAYHILLGCD